METIYLVDGGKRIVDIVVVVADLLLLMLGPYVITVKSFIFLNLNSHPPTTLIFIACVHDILF